MRFVILAVFAAACVSSFLWFEAGERHFNRLQATTLGLTALTAWALVLVLVTIF